MTKKTIEEILAMEKVEPRRSHGNEESRLQISCVRWFRLQYKDYLLISVPNGGYRTARTGAIMKAEGQLKGAADLLLLKGNKWYGYLALEMKTTKGRQSPEQKDFERAVNMSGGRYVVVRSFEEFEKVIREYLNDGRLDKDT